MPGNILHSPLKQGRQKQTDVFANGSIAFKSRMFNSKSQLFLTAPAEEGKNGRNLTLCVACGIGAKTQRTTLTHLFSGLESVFSKKPCLGLHSVASGGRLTRPLTLRDFGQKYPAYHWFLRGLTPAINELTCLRT